MRSTGSCSCGCVTTLAPRPIWNVDAEGRTTGEIVRSLKRYIAREIFKVLPRSLLTS
jgi:hypothetical protein